MLALADRPVGMMSTKLLRVGDMHGYPYDGIGHWCPGCRMMHVFAIEPDLKGNRWTWNRSIGKPTFAPYMLATWKGFLDLAPAGRCHYSLTGGIIHFLADCTHRLSGKRASLPDLPGHLIELPRHV